MSWYEFRHLLRDLRARRWHDYPYAKRGDRLHQPEMLLRRLNCRIRGHNYPAAHSWKSWCSRCFKVAA